MRNVLLVGPLVDLDELEAELVLRLAKQDSSLGGPENSEEEMDPSLDGVVD